MMTITTVNILVTYKDGKKIQQIRSIKHRSYSFNRKIKSVCKNKLKKYEKELKKINSDIVSIELIQLLNYEVSDNKLIEI